jgi:hypothetical protein
MGMGRRSKYTPELVKKLCHAIELGATYELACQYAGISYEIFRQWRETKVGFLAAINDAEGKAVVGWLNLIEASAADGSWQAAAWKLERRYPHLYGRTVNEHTGKDGGPIKHDHTHRDLSIFSDEEIANLANVAERAKAGRA